MTVLYKSGRDVDPMKLRSADLDIRDIAHNLSMICRFTGAFPFHYSVGHHSLLVCWHVGAAGHDAQTQLAGLLHDAAEFLFNDIASPIKHHPMMAGYRKLEHEVSRMILANYGCDPDLLTIVKPYDTKVYQLEVAVRNGISKAIPQHSPATVYSKFMAVFDRLSAGIA